MTFYGFDIATSVDYSYSAYASREARDNDALAYLELIRSRPGKEGWVESVLLGEIEADDKEKAMALMRGGDWSFKCFGANAAVKAMSGAAQVQGSQQSFGAAPVFGL